MASIPLASTALVDGLSLLATIELAVRDGQWTVDGACDPDGLKQSLHMAIDCGDLGQVERYTSLLARGCLDAIDTGDWIPEDGTIEYLELLAPPADPVDYTDLSIH